VAQGLLLLAGWLHQPPAEQVPSRQELELIGQGRGLDEAEHRLAGFA